jgi:hypothetical protein
VAVHVLNGTLMDGQENAGLKGLVYATDRRAFAFRVNTKSPGKLIFQVVCSAGKFNDASRIEIEVQDPPTLTSFVFDGELRKKGDVLCKKIQVPNHARRDAGTFQVWSASLCLFISIRN